MPSPESKTLRKPRKRYLEPKQQYALPKQTKHNRSRSLLLASSQIGQTSANVIASTSATNTGDLRNDASDENWTRVRGNGVSNDCRSSSDEIDAEPEGSSSDSEGEPSPEEDTGTGHASVRDDSFGKSSHQGTLPHQATTQAQALLLVLAYVVSAGLSWTQIDGLLKLINALFGETVLPNSKYLFRKIWGNEKDDMIDFHFFCGNCHELLAVCKKPTRTQRNECHSCHSVYRTDEMIEKGTFFLIFNLKSQIEDLLKTCKKILLENLDKIAQRQTGVLRDITDGHLIRAAREKLGCASHDLTASVSTDGSSVFKSSKASIWPIHVVINELPVIARWQNTLLGGLWFGSGKPDMFLYLNAFVAQFNKIEKVVWECFRTGRVLSSKVYALCCVADAPARAAVLNRKQFNGYFGCPWCYQRGTLVQGTLKYPFTSDRVERTHKGILQDMRAATKKGEPVRGVFGPSPLLKLKGLDLVWGVVPDYMHCVLEGVVKQLTEVWFSDTGSACYIGTMVETVNQRLLGICPPNLFSRLPRPVGERAQWKAKEWRYWLLYYSLPCLNNILPRQYFAHLTLLCEAIFLLLKKSVTTADLTTAEELLVRFALRVSDLYGAAAETSNMHLLLHLPKSVSQLGPLWATSMFPFESASGLILELITAAKGVAQQVGERCVMQQSLRLMGEGASLPEQLRNVFNLFMRFKVRREEAVLGAPLALVPTRATRRALEDYFGTMPILERYQRATIQGFHLNSIEYKRCKKTCTRFIKMRDEHFCEIRDIFQRKPDGALFLLCKILIISNANMGSAQYIHSCLVPPDEESLCIYPSTDVGNVCVFIAIQGVSYLCDMPNSYERE